MTKDERFFIQIISDHLLGKETKSYNNIDWKYIARLAHIHQVDGIVYYQCKDFIPAEVKKAFEYPYRATLFYYVNRKNTMDEIGKAFSEAGIMFFVLKGFEIAKYYPIPCLRTMGDCDILISRKDMQRATDILRKLEFKGSDNIHVEHWAFDKNGIHFELHDNVIQEDECTNARQNRFFNNYKQFVHEGSLDWNFHFLFLLMHLRKHLITSGAGIRQFMDLAVIIKGIPELDWKWVKKQTKKLHIEHFTEICLSLVQEWFGVYAPINVDHLDKSVTDELTEKILKNGVFGFEDKRNQFNRARKMLLAGSSPLWFKRIRKMIRDLFPTYEFMRGYPHCRFLENRKILLPVAWAYRWIFILRGKNNIDSKNAVRHTFAENAEMKKQREFLKKMGL